jgi:TNF receptor-associated factor 4
MEDHLNVNPKPDQRFFGCEYVNETCIACYGKFPRGVLEQHEMKKCPKRPYTCEYCCDYSATCDEVVERHWPICPERPAPCANECGVYPLRKHLERHLKYECDLRQPEADLATPDEIRKYVESTVKTQLSSAALKLLIKEEINKDQDTVLELRATIEELKEAREEAKKLRAELEQLKLEHIEDHESLSKLKTHISIVPATFTLNDYKARRMRKDRGWTSSYFYTFPRGYRMCLLVDVGGPTGQNSLDFVSVYLCITRGDFDGQLKWPFRGSVEVSLISQEPGKLDHTEVIKYHENTHLASSGRVRGEEASKPWGKGRFIRHDQLELGGFVLNDELKFQVLKVTLDV